MCHGGRGDAPVRRIGSRRVRRAPLSRRSGPEMIRVGTAGWSYPDWEGLVYPRGSASSKRSLVLLAGMFDVLEINTTFYRPPNPRMAEGWAERVASHPAFRFTAKLWQGFTHERDETHPAEEAAFKEGIDPLRQAGRLGALLIQFPHSFRNSQASRAYLTALLDRFAGDPLVVELRHVSWLSDEVLALLDARGAGYCNVDQPLVGSASPPTTIITGSIGYARLHGRNREAWFKKDAGRDARYDYLYSHEEIRGWAERIRLMQRKAKGGADIFIIANNHYRGQAAANALEIVHALTGEPVAPPASLVEAYPRLAAIASPSQRQEGPA